MAKKAHHNSVTKYALTGLSALGVFAVSTQVANADQVTVKAGDTVWGIAQQHGLTTHGLEAANPTAIKKVNNSVDLIYAGQRLNLSQPQQTANQVQADGTYVVAPGETLSQIAQRFHVSVNSLLAWNHLSSTQLYIGQRLIVSGPATNVSVPVQPAAQPVENSVATDTATNSAAPTTASVVAQPVSAPVQTTADNNGDVAVQNSANTDQPAQSATVQSAAPVQASATASVAVAAQSAAVQTAQTQSTATVQQSLATSTSAPASQAQLQTAASAQSQQSSVAVNDQQSATVQSNAAQSAAAVQANPTTGAGATATGETASQAPANSQVQQSTASQSSAAVSTVSASATNTASSQPAVYSQAAVAGNQQTVTATSSAASQAAQVSSASSQPQSVAASSAASQTSTAVQSANASQQSAQTATATTQTQQTQSQSSNLQTGSVVSLAVKIANSNSVPYVWGGSSLSGMDCSGLVDYVYANAEGKQLPHNTVALESYVSQHSVSEAQSGDILFWGNHGSTYHCAIYIGNNQYVAAAKPGTNVSVYTISKYFEPSFAGTVK